MIRKSDEELKAIFNNIKDVVKLNVDLSLKNESLKSLEKIYNTALQESNDIKTIKKIKKYLEKNERKYNYKEYEEKKIDDYKMEEWK